MIREHTLHNVTHNSITCVCSLALRRLFTDFQLSSQLLPEGRNITIMIDVYYVYSVIDGYNDVRMVSFTLE